MCSKMITAPHENECSISEYSISYKSINMCDSLELELTLGLQNHLVLIWRVPFHRNLNWALDSTKLRTKVVSFPNMFINNNRVYLKD